MIAKHLTFSNFLFFVAIFLLVMTDSDLHAETVTGGGYTVQQVIAPIQGALSGNGYVLQQSSQVPGSKETGGGYVVTSVFGSGTVAVITPPPPSPSPYVPQVSGGGFFIFIDPYGYRIPPTPIAPSSTPQVEPTNPTSTSHVVIVGTSTVPTVVDSGSTCKSRITFTRAIDIGSKDNLKEDVEKLEIFLNTYEGENLPVNGIYEGRDIAAVKRWQMKYRSYVLDPMLLKNPTGTIYTLSQRQIERQTTKPCGEPVVVTACPYFKEYSYYGQRGPTVRKIQQFLNVVRGENLPLSGVYGPLTRAATKRFQQAYRKDVFNILKLSFISGNWNEATRVKANQAIGCDIIK